jgi:8-oxo-dGTP pyrophosphatase MutT (NUDIX family)
MLSQKSAGAVIYHKSRQDKNEEIRYLLLHYPSGSRMPGKDYWDFPKGHMETDESPQEAAIREVEEETGLTDIKFIEGFEEQIKYFFQFKGKPIFKIVTFFLFKTETEAVKISSEHINYKWLSYEQALAQLTFANAKEILKKANDFLLNKVRA